MTQTLRAIFHLFMLIVLPWTSTTYAGWDRDKLQLVPVVKQDATPPVIDQWRAQQGEAALVWESMTHLNQPGRQARLRLEKVTDNASMAVLFHSLLHHLQQEKLLDGHLSLGLGRLEEFPPHSRLLTLQVASLKKHGGWDFQRGRPSGADSPNAFVLKQLRKIDPALSPILSLLRQYQLAANWSGVEKVLVRRVWELPWKQEMLDAGLGPMALVPVDVMVWLDLQPLHQAKATKVTEGVLEVGRKQGRQRHTRKP